METCSETGNANDCQNNPELSEKQQKKKSGKKKKKSRKQENELKNNDSHDITSLNDAFSSEERKEKSTSEGQVQLSENLLPAESCQQDSVSCEEPGATLHHSDPIFSTREDSLPPDANSNASGKKRTKKRGKKKKEGASCEEIMLDDAEKTTNEDQVHPPNNLLSCEQTQDSCQKPGAAQLCVDPNLSTPEDSQPNATNISCSKKRKRKKDKDIKAQKESGVDILSSSAEVAAKYNTNSEAGGSSWMSIEEKTVDSLVINSCLKSKDDTVEQQEGTDVILNETVAQTQIPKSKKKKKRKTNAIEVCDTLGNTKASSTKSGPVDLARQKENSASEEESGIQNLEKTKKKETDETTEVKEDAVAVKCNTTSEAEGSKSTSVEEISVASVVIKSKDDAAEQRESTDVKLDETVVETQTPKAKKKKKRKTKTMEVCDPIGNTLATSTKSEPVECVENNDVNVGRALTSHVAIKRGNSSTGEESVFQNRENTKEKETDENTDVKEDAVEVNCNTISEAEGSKSASVEEKAVASVVINRRLNSKDDAAEQRESVDVKLDETVAQTQTPKAKKKKKRKTKMMEVCDPIGNNLATSTKSEPVECVENNDVNSGRELMSNLASQGGNSATGEESGFQNLEKTKEKETDVKEDVLEVKYSSISEADGSKSVSIEEKSVASAVINSCLESKNDTAEQQESTGVKLDETVAQTQTPKAKKKKKRKTKMMEVCDPIGNTLATSTKIEPVECVENNVVSGGLELMSNLASQGGNSATGEENGFQNLEKTKEKETDEKTDVKEDVLEVKYSSISEGEGSKSVSIEEKSVASAVINSCLESKNDTAEQQESTDVKPDETMAQTQTPKAKKKKKRKTKMMEVCDPIGNTLATSTKIEPVECVENNDVSGGLELMSNLASQGGNSATGEENGFQNLEKTKEKETDVKEDVLEVKYSSISEAEGSKSVSIEEKSVASAVINSCLESKNDTAEQQESTDVKPDETMAQTQTPKAKKKKKRKTKMMEVCDPIGNTLATSTKSEAVECVENSDVHGGRELMTILASQGGISATGEENDFHNLEKMKEKETEENNEVKEDVLGAGVCEVRSKKRKGKKKRTSSEDHKTADMEVCDPTGSVEGLLDHSNQEDMKSCDGNAGQEFGGEDMTSKIEFGSGVGKSGKRKEMTKDIESSQDAVLEEGVSDVGCKRQKRKRNKKTNCESAATMDTESVQCLLYDSNGEGLQNCDGNADGEIASKEDLALQNCDGNADGEIASKEDLASITENSATKGESVEDVEMKKDKKEEVDEDALGAEGVNQDECKDDEIDNMEKEDVSLPRCSCEGQRTRKLVVFDLNGILADIVQGHTGNFVPDGKVSYRSVFRRPFVASFLDFCFERFDVAIWSSRRIGLDYMINIVMRNYARNLLFCFDQAKCSATNFKTLENNNKPLFLKDLRRVWDRFGTCFSCGKRKFDEANTLLIDDSPEKALCNPPHTGIFPFPYQYTDREDSALGPDGELRKYLQRLADANNVQKFVAENPFGQTAITETHESWEFYSKVIDANK